jgi:hypothetical protein
MAHGWKMRPSLSVAAALIAVSPALATEASEVSIKARATSERNRPRAAQAIMAIAARQGACRDRERLPRTIDLQECDWAASEAYDKLMPRSGTNTRFAALLSDLSDAFLFALTPGDFGHDALKMRVVVSSEYADLSRRRTGILMGAARLIPSARVARHAPGLFDWIDRMPGLSAWMQDSDFSTRVITRRWLAIRNADCAAYPVPRCAERLDDAMRRTVRELTRPDRRYDMNWRHDDKQ